MAAPSLPDPAAVLSVTALTRQVREVLEGRFPALWVGGEISNVNRASSGHVYLTLKDSTAVMSAVIYRGVGFRIRFEPRVGMEVIARGRLSVFEQQGKYQFNVEEIHPKGIGALELAIQQLREKLERKGYFDRRRKRRLPAYPRTIALVTSPTGAAVRDMLEILGRRWPVAAVLVVPVRVQGDGCAAEIADAIRRLNHLHGNGHLRLDVLIVGRGGGSLEDLWAFNEEPVADAIFASVIPVISAVGHEIDVTISDLVADHRALTPSHAITDLTPDRVTLVTSLFELESRLKDRVISRIKQARQKLDALADRRAFRSPLDRIRDLEKRLDELDGRLGRSANIPVERARQRISGLASQLESLSPLNVLARGYSLTRTSNGQVISDAAAVSSGDLITTRLAHGELTSRVEQTRPASEEMP
jgi:exodeoxyribonuclease VII large subunit